jgi:hypothetical protein
MPRLRVTTFPSIRLALTRHILEYPIRQSGLVYCDLIYPSAAKDVPDGGIAGVATQLAAMLVTRTLFWISREPV